MPILILIITILTSHSFISLTYPNILDDPKWSKDVRTFVVVLILATGITLAWWCPYEII